VANEITVTSSFKLENGNDSYTRTVSYNADQSSVGGPSPGVLLIGTSHEAVAPTDLSILGWAIFKNLDTTNYVEIGVEVTGAFYPLLKLLPGEQVQVRLSPAVLVFARSNVAAVRLESQIFHS
jgi:hypothetical protein